ncbi:hypothetical protein AYK26_06870 [Euryarchaeota archaeon SM23-78]|nr:MAG: hypothetical protein AYK26_06870 [Euryarchaeota archaeon SM23-78]MBW3000385.1 type II secretion system F family protein [Candidatus Woesearchaeota archaeon]
MTKKAAKTTPESKNKFRLFTETLGDSIIPGKYRKNILNYLDRASIEEVPYFSYGLAVYVTFVLSVILDILFLRTRLFANTNIIIMIILSIIIIPLIFIILSLISILAYRICLDAMIYHKTRKMEEVFPEFLAELSINLKAGQSLEEALENSTEKEFGYLKDEIAKVCKKVRLGTDVEVALREFIENYDSEVIEETFDLIITSWKKGARTSQLVERIFDNLDMMRYLRRKVIASVTSYRIFLSIVTVIIAPAMFALAFYLVNLIKSIINKITLTTTSVTFPIAINAVRVNDLHFTWFSILALALIAISTAMIISIIKTGSIKEGYKQVVFYAGGTILSYYIFMLIFRYFFALFNV